MHILHISSDFCNTPVHKNLYVKLSERGIDQTIYCPVRSAQLIGRNYFLGKGTDIIYDFVLKPYHRYLFHIKRNSVFRSLQRKVNFSEVDLVHASTLFSDGCQACKIFKKYQIPYVVTVRTTDVTVFLERVPNAWIDGREILLNAQKIYFISPSIIDKFTNHFVVRSILSKIQDKFKVIPNGIDDYYCDNVNGKCHGGHKVLYVGNFTPNKNVVRLCEAILELKKESNFHDISLTLIGDGGGSKEKVLELVKNNKTTLEYLGPVFDKERLCKIYRSHSVFAMPSIHETLGLVYLEAISQNLPVVYTKKEGIDGLFDGTVGIGVNPLSVDDIKMAIRDILSSPNTYNNYTIDFHNYRWSKIAADYISDYRIVTHLQ